MSHAPQVCVPLGTDMFGLTIRCRAVCECAHTTQNLNGRLTKSLLFTAALCEHLDMGCALKSGLTTYFCPKSGAVSKVFRNIQVITPPTGRESVESIDIRVVCVAESLITVEKVFFFRLTSLCLVL